MTPDATAVWPLVRPYDFFETTRLLRTGGRDPTLRREADGLWRAAHTPDGPVTVRLTVGDTLRADAWGPGATRAMADVPRWVGLHEAPWTLPPHPRVDALLRAHPGVRGTDTRDVFEAVVNATLQQLVTWTEAAGAWRRLCEHLGEPAPGPGELRLSPTPRAIRAAGADALRGLGVGMSQARTLVEAARAADGLQGAADLPTGEAIDRLLSVRGIGPWTAGMVLGLRLGRPEPVPIGDFHLPHDVAWALAGEPRATDARMVALLTPFEGHAFRVVRLIFAARVHAPRRGPRRAPGRHRY